MKFGYLVLVTVGGIMAGCATHQTAGKFADPATVSATETNATSPETGRPVGDGDSGAPASSKLLVTAEQGLAGTVVTFNQAGRFVVLDFAPGKMPAVDQTLFVYRQGLKVGEVRVTGPQRDHNTVADLVSGEALKGDVVRDK
ncbi:MAG TPA: hypothetical protein PKN95_11390 [Verrucomicrobiota bacterium]|nr:hypothetical protein [Verrucomicrobiota bacterium]HNT14606.1 hypothetical protein [Verrucomicrobiota bacterium]